MRDSLDEPYHNRSRLGLSTSCRLLFRGWSVAGVFLASYGVVAVDEVVFPPRVLAFAGCLLINGGPSFISASRPRRRLSTCL